MFNTQNTENTYKFYIFCIYSLSIALSIFILFQMPFLGSLIFLVSLANLLIYEKIKNLNLNNINQNQEINEKLAHEIDRINTKRNELVLALNESKNLIKVLCHDLSNSLTVIIGSSSRAIRNKQLGEGKKNELWSRVHIAALSQKELIDHVRNMERNNNGKINLQLEKVCLNEIIGKSYFMLEQHFMAKNINLTISFHSENPIYILAEPVTLFNNIFNNLISNAIKFSFENSIITIKSEEFEEIIKVQIIDRGIGISADLLNELIKCERPITRIGTNGEKGTGFGLTLVFSYLEHYGARIEITSKDIDSYPTEHGTTISLYFKKYLSN